MIHSCKMCAKRKYCIYKPTSDVADCGYFVRSKQTNADRIRAMSDKELTKVLGCPYEIGICIHIRDNIGCDECILKWLKSEVKE